MERQVLRRCEACGGVLLSCDYIGRGARHLDSALLRHDGTPSSSCQSNPVQEALRTLEASLQDPDTFCSTAPWPEEEPPLIFCARHDLLNTALRLLAHGALPAPLDHIAPCGAAAIHVAAHRLGGAPFVTALIKSNADPLTPTQDGGTSCVGGQLALHIAAASGDAQTVRVLLEAEPVAARIADWDGHIPASVALHAGHWDLALELIDAAQHQLAAGRGDGSGEDVEAVSELAKTVQQAGKAAGGAVPHAPLQEHRAYQQLRRLGLVEREKDRLCLVGRGTLRTAHLVRGLFTHVECSWLLRELRDAASLHGWHGSRHRHYATEDLPLWQAPVAASWVRQQVQERIFPCMAAAFGIPWSDLRLQECFAVRYEPGGQPSLSYHRDNTLLSFNVLLTDDFSGGGTCFGVPISVKLWPDGGVALLSSSSAAGGSKEGGHMLALDSGSSVPGERGACLLHSGQVLHGAGAVSTGVRVILVGFVSEIVRHDR